MKSIPSSRRMLGVTIYSFEGSDDLEFKFSVKQNVNFGSSNFELLYREAVVSQSPGLLQPWVTD